MKPEKRKNRTLAMVLAATCMLGSLLSVAWAQKLVTPGYLFNSDPSCHSINGKFYLFTTQDPVSAEFIMPNKFYKGMFDWHALSTTDFDHWVDHGSILTSQSVDWDGGMALWDGDAGIRANGQYYAYAPFRVNSAKEANYGIYDIGVFTSSSPIGPYKDVYNAPMKMADGSPLRGLSPSLVRAVNGEPYLIWGSGDTTQHQVMLARLKPDMVQLAESPRILSVPVKDKCGSLEYFESPVLFHIGPRWYLTFVTYKGTKGAGCDEHGSWVDYTISKSMFGPFDGPVHHLIYPAGDGEESIQQGVCEYRGKLYLAYHVPYETVEGDRDHHRQVAVTSLVVLPNGLLKPVIPGEDAGVGTPGVTYLTLDAFAPRREADEFQTRLNAMGEKGVKGEYQMALGDGGYLEFHNVDFGKGAAQFRVEISSGNNSLRDGSLEIRLDDPAGPLIARISVPVTGGAEKYQVLGSPVSLQARGIHNLFLVAHGKTSSAQRRLFNIAWFAFTERKSHGSAN